MNCMEKLSHKFVLSNALVIELKMYARGPMKDNPLPIQDFMKERCSPLTVR